MSNISLIYKKYSTLNETNVNTNSIIINGFIAFPISPISRILSFEYKSDRNIGLTWIKISDKILTDNKALKK